MFTTYQAKLLEKKQISPEVHYFKFSHPPEAEWYFKAGQYMIFHIPQGENHAARRQYSIASHPAQKESLEFIIEYLKDGVASKHLAQMEAGQELTFQGPAGVFTYRQAEKSPVFLATGTGIAPIFSIISDQLINNGYTSPISLFWGLKHKSDMYYFDQLKELANKHKNFNFKICLSREENLPSLFTGDDLQFCTCGRITKGFEDMISQTKVDTNNFNYYICGSKHIVEAMREYLNNQSVPQEQVFFEKFTL